MGCVGPGSPEVLGSGVEMACSTWNRSASSHPMGVGGDSDGGSRSSGCLRS